MKQFKTLILSITLLSVFSGFSQITTKGELKKWHKVTLEIEGPSASETGTINPFLDYKLTGIFTQGTSSYEIPGYFAADGDASETSASSGNVWRIHFAPPKTGIWNYTIRFREGSNIAIGTNITAGSAVSNLDNTTGTISIGQTDKSAPDLRAKGQLQYVGEHHLQFAETGEYFMKVGPDSPENLLAYDDIDNTPNFSDFRKSWTPHIRDWNNGDPTWKNGKGKGLIGAINYLESEGMNTFSFLTMNIKGDDRNVFPYISDREFTRFDCSKLDQWEIVFNHGQNKGMHLHFKMMEQENDNILDGGATRTQRKVYVRELVARFGHHLALNWNLGEETRLTTSEIKDFAKYMSDTDAYDHHIVIHTSITQQDRYIPLLGDASDLTGASLQTLLEDIHDDTRTWVTSSAESGKKWVVANDEQGPSPLGVPEDDYTGRQNKDDVRHQALWGTIMAGGAGVEYYFGRPNNAKDLTAQDFRTRDISWDYCRYAFNFFTNYIPFWEMSSADNLSSDRDDYVLAKTDNDPVYVIYLPSGGSTAIDLRDASGSLDVKWFDPRNGGDLQNGSVTAVTGGGTVNTGNPPNNASKDWVVLITGEAQPCSNEPDTTPQNDVLSGIIYKYYEGSWNNLPNFETLTPLATGLTATIDLSKASSADNFGLTFNGYILVPTDGAYTFYTTSDDGSALWIDGKKVVDNDGTHSAKEESGQICLEEGYHLIRIEYFEKTGGNVLSAAYAGPGIPKTVLTSPLYISETLLSIEDLSKLSFDIFPNPFLETLSIHNKYDSKIQIEIINSLGQVLLNKQIDKKINTLDVSQLASGLYFIRIVSSDNQFQIKRLVKK